MQKYLDAIAPEAVEQRRTDITSDTKHDDNEQETGHVVVGTIVDYC